jgi:uncharacterized protein (DUF1501 family)
VLSWSPQRIQAASDDTMMRLLDLYRHTDPALARSLEGGATLAQIARVDGMDGKPQENQNAQQNPQQAGVDQVHKYFAEVAGAAGKFLARPDGPRVGALALDGWDTHFNEGIEKGRLSQLLNALDGAIAALETSMGPAWNETVVTLITEFGRTAKINGTDGTDHGTATVTLLVGGALRGGRVVADWPGLKPAKLYEARDLAPTTDLRAVLKGVMRDHLRADERALGRDVFPGSENVKPLEGLVKA